MYRKARDWGERLVSGWRRQRMNWSRRWAEHHYNQHHFFQALAENGWVEVSEMGLMKYRSEMVTPLHQWSSQARTRYLNHRAKSCKWLFPESVLSFKRGVYGKQSIFFGVIAAGLDHSKKYIYKKNISRSEINNYVLHPILVHSSIMPEM